MSTPGVVESPSGVKDIRPGFVSILVPGAKHSFDLWRREEAFHRRIVSALSAPAHTAGDALIDQQALEVLAGVLGVFNRSSQHLNHGGVYGATRGVDAEVDWARSNALARCAVASV